MAVVLSQILESKTLDPAGTASEGLLVNLFKNLEDIMLPENLEKTIRESTHRLWLAGLGAIALVEEKKNDLMDRLVEKGQSHKLHDQDPSQMAAEILENCRNSAESYRTSMESIIETKLSEATSQLGLASRKEIDQIATRLDKLSKLLGNLMEKNSEDRQDTPEKK